MNKAWPSYMHGQCICFEPYWLLYLNLKLCSAKVYHFSDILQAFYAVMYLWEPKKGGGGRSVGLLYCLLLSAWYFMIQSQVEWNILQWCISWSRMEEVEGAWDSCTVYYSLLGTLWYSQKWNKHLAVMHLLEPKGGGGVSSVGLFYCLLLFAWYFMIKSQMDGNFVQWCISWSRREEEVEGAWAFFTVYFSLHGTFCYCHKRSGTSCSQWGRRLEGLANTAARLAGWRRVTQQVSFCTWWTGRTACLFCTVTVALAGAALCELMEFPAAVI